MSANSVANGGRRSVRGAPGPEPFISLHLRRRVRSIGSTTAAVLLVYIKRRQMSTVTMLGQLRMYEGTVSSSSSSSRAIHISHSVYNPLPVSSRVPRRVECAGRADPGDTYLGASRVRAVTRPRRVLWRMGLDRAHDDEDEDEDEDERRRGDTRRETSALPPHPRLLAPRDASHVRVDSEPRSPRSRVFGCWGAAQAMCVKIVKM